MICQNIYRGAILIREFENLLLKLFSEENNMNSKVFAESKYANAINNSSAIERMSVIYFI
jgi:hypothetical protein